MLLSWFSLCHSYVEASFNDSSFLTTILDNLARGGVNVYVRSYTQCRMTAVTGASIVTHCHLLSQFHVALSCLSTLEGGGWALVRRVGQGSTWSSATDNLAGIASFGVTSSRPVDTTSLSIPFSRWLWPSTEILFATGDFFRFWSCHAF
jgi:hypothetical protein